MAEQLPAGRHIEAFLEMLAAERGAARNTLAAYQADLADFNAFVTARDVAVHAADAPTLRAYLAGDPGVCRVVAIPTPEVEDAKRLSRERTRLASERTRHVNRIRGLLSLHGIRSIKGALGWCLAHPTWHAEDGGWSPPGPLHQG